MVHLFTIRVRYVMKKILFPSNMPRVILSHRLVPLQSVFLTNLCLFVYFQNLLVHVACVPIVNMIIVVVCVTFKELRRRAGVSVQTTNTASCKRRRNKIQTAIDIPYSTPKGNINASYLSYVSYSLRYLTCCNVTAIIREVYLRKDWGGCPNLVVTRKLEKWLNFGARTSFWWKIFGLDLLRHKNF